MARNKTEGKKVVDAIRIDLKDQLSEKALFGTYYEDLVDDYCKYYEVKEMLFGDIKKRGVQIPYNNGGGQSGVKRNDSIAEVNKVTATMMNIIRLLGLEPPKTKPSDGGEPDDLV